MSFPLVAEAILEFDGSPVRRVPHCRRTRVVRKYIPFADSPGFLGGRHAALERDGPSDGELDGAAISDDRPGQSDALIRDPRPRCH